MIYNVKISFKNRGITKGTQYNKIRIFINSYYERV